MARSIEERAPKRRWGQYLAVGSLATVSMTGHVIYPLVLGVVTRKYPPHQIPPIVTWPSVSVLIPAYLEQQVIEAKVADVRKQAYPGALEIIVVADDVDTYTAARRTGVTVLHNRSRQGKSAAVNAGVAAARHQVVVLTDANALLQPAALTQLVRHFVDPTVGAVAGAKQVLDSTGQGFYWKFESWLKSRESRLGTTMGMVGELAAFRRDLFRPLPQPLIADDLWLNLDIIESGFRVLFEPTALAVELGSPGIAVEWERRTRIITGTLDVLWRRPNMLLPGTSPVAGQLWGHKLVRSTIGPLAHVALLGYLAGHRAGHRGSRSGRLARLTIVGHVVGLAGVAHMARGGELPRLLQLPAQVLFLQAVALAGLARFLKGDRRSIWPKTERALTPDMEWLMPKQGRHVETGRLRSLPVE
ncbi:MAG: glycosyltransferase [Frankiaceae bacterium]